MAHTRRSAALASALLLATLTLRCESQTFDLLPESGAGSDAASGSGGNGGKGNSNKGGTSGSGGRASGGKNSGGQFGAGVPSVGGFTTISGGRTGGCGSDDDCLGMGPAKYCQQGFCLECTRNEHCLDPLRPVCNSKNGRCGQCSMPSDCPDATPFCDTRLNACVGCLDDRSCKEPRKCEPDIHACVECYDRDHCPEERPVCNTQIYKCIECFSQSDCVFSPADSGWCDHNQCACDNDTQCMGSPFGPHCITGHCRECGPPQYTCPDGEMCDQNGKCVMR